MGALDFCQRLYGDNMETLAMMAKLALSVFELKSQPHPWTPQLYSEQ